DAHYPTPFCCSQPARALAIMLKAALTAGKFCLVARKMLHRSQKSTNLPNFFIHTFQIIT
ncbi:MAG: hypothetical protein ACR2OX_00040, partial [Methyloligellaceae bacterium]